ncbi:MAG: pirin family protein [Chromatiales bacterium]|jgi:redox-sensitive bicupin YhaK (pirin superfamily)|nr:pirin family protein [Chromatiales bacterium]
MSKEIIRATEIDEAEGIHVQRLMPAPRSQNYGPFVRWDQFSVGPSASSVRRSESGCETLVYLWSGALRHEDDLGRGTVIAGGARCLTAGRGVEQSETPQGGVPVRGIRLSIDLPRRLKKSAPACQQVYADQLPVRKITGGRITTIVGDGSPLASNGLLRCQELRLDPGATWQENLPDGYRGLVYSVSGSAAVGGSSIDDGEACLFDDPGKYRIEAREECRLMCCLARTVL